MPPGALILSIMVSVVILLVGLAFFVLVRVSGGDEMGERLQTYAAMPELAQQTLGRKGSRFARQRLRLNAMLSALNSEELTFKLMSANWPMTASEFILLRFAATAGAFLLVWLISRSLLPALGGAILAYIVPGILLSNGINKRRRLFEKQLIDVLVLLTGAVRGGFSLLQAIEVVVREMQAPASEEFRRVLMETGLGLPVNQALVNLVERMENDDLSLLVTAVNIHSQVGGNLTVMMEAVTETIRERIRLFAEVRVLTTQQRYTGYLLSLLPVFVGAAMFMINSEYMYRLFQPDMLCYPIAAVVSVLLGQFVIRRMVNIQV